MPIAIDAGFPVTGRDTSGTAGLTWPTFTTPAGNRLILAMALENGPAARTIATFTSGSLTWTKITGASGIDTGNNWCNEFWWAWASGAVTTEAITSTDNSGASWGRRSMVILSLSGSSSSGIGNSSVETGLTDTKPNIAVTGSGSGSMIIGGFAYRSAGSDVGINASTTSVYDAGFGGGFGFNERAGRRTGSGSLTLSWDSGDDVFNMGIISAVEIIESGGASPADLIRRGNRSPWGNGQKVRRHNRIFVPSLKETLLYNKKAA